MIQGSLLILGGIHGRRVFTERKADVPHLAVLPFGAWRSARRRQASDQRYRLCDPIWPAMERRIAAAVLLASAFSSSQT